MNDPSGKQLNNKMPSIETFLLKTPLYKSFYIDSIEEIKDYYKPLDSFCIGCNKTSVFKGYAKKIGTDNGPTSHRPQPPPPPIEEYFTLEFFCQRVHGHKLKFFIYYSVNEVQKIGQYPSLADLDQNAIKKYRKVLGNKYVELSRAVGLAAHGIGIGSFIYLRRIFESLIEEAHSKSTIDKDWNEDIYTNSRMKEKIKLLKNHLPPFLVKNSSIYSILSVGVHSLNEDDCLGYFNPLKYSIELILDEKIEEEEKKKKIESAAEAIKEIERKLKNDK